MIPKEEAKKLVNKFRKYSRLISSGFWKKNEDVYIESAKQCALIAINERIEEANQWKSSFMGNERMNHLEQVKLEIEKI